MNMDEQEWRAGLGARLDKQDRRADEQSELIDSMRGELEINTRKTDELVANTGELIEMFRSWQGAMKVLETIGKAAKPLAAIAGLAAAVGAWWVNWKVGK